MMKKFKDRKSLESTRFETLEDLVRSAIYYALGDHIIDDDWRSENAEALTSNFCDGQDAGPAESL
jgi:hypothetical protein